MRSGSAMLPLPSARHCTSGTPGRIVHTESSPATPVCPASTAGRGWGRTHCHRRKFPAGARRTSGAAGSNNRLTFSSAGILANSRARAMAVCNPPSSSTRPSCRARSPVHTRPCAILSTSSTFMCRPAATPSKKIVVGLAHILQHDFPLRRGEILEGIFQRGVLASWQ